MALVKAVVKYRIPDRKINTVLEDLKNAINNTIDEVDTIDTTSSTHITNITSHAWEECTNGIRYPYTGYTGNVGVGMDADSAYDFSVDNLAQIYSSSAQPKFRMVNASDTERDPVIQFMLGATPAVEFTLGVDDSDSDKWKLSNQSSLSSSTEGVVYDTQILVCDWDNARIQRLNTSTGSYIDKNTSINAPCGACAYDDFIYITDSKQLKKLKKSDLSVVATQGDVAGGSGDDDFDNPQDCCTDGIFVYVADTANDRIKKHYCSDLSYHSKFGTYGSGDDNFNSPRGICYADGYLFITDTDNDRLKKHSASDLTYDSKIGSTGSGNDQFDGPNHCETDETNVYICDASNSRLKAHACSDLAYVDSVTDAGSTYWGVDVDDDEIYIGNYGGNNVKVYDTATLTLQRTLSQLGSGDGDIDSPKGVCTFYTRVSTGDLLVAFQDGSYLESYPTHRFYNAIDLMEDSDTRTDYIRFIAPTSITNTYQLTLPDDLPSAKNHVYSSTAGELGWGQNVDTDGSPTFVGLTLSGLTATRLVSTDGSSQLASTDLNSWVTGTANQVSVADDGDGTITLSTPQDIATTSSVTFDIVNATTKYQCASTDILAWDTNEPGARYTLFVGSSGGGTITTARYGIGIGVGALASSTEGYYNVCIGWNAGASINTGGSNICIGSSSGDALTSGASNIAIGASALSTEDTQSYNIAIGGSALGNQDGAARNICLGYRCGLSIATASDNIGIGDQCFRTNSHTGLGRNIAIGTSACAAATTAVGNVAIGYRALNTNTTGSYNVAIGYDSLQVADGVGSLVAIGFATMESATTASYTTGVGNAVLQNLEDGNYNTAYGYQSGQDNVSGANNTYIGSRAGYNSTGSFNTFLGAGCGNALVAGDNGVYIGYHAGTSDPDANKLYIDTLSRASQANDQALSLITGTFAATTAAQDVRMNANVGIGTATFGTNADFVFSMATKTAPTTSPADQFQMYCADVDGTAGRAGPHFWLEDTNAVVALGRGRIFFDSSPTNFTFGNNNMTSATTAASCIAIGSGALAAVVDGSHNFAIGNNALGSVTDGTQNIGIGYEAGGDVTSGESNCYIGYGAGQYNSGSYNFAIGPQTLRGSDGTSSGGYNVGIGNQVAYSLTLGTYNVGIGHAAQYDITEGVGNIAIGGNVQNGITTGSYNIGIGFQAQQLASANLTSDYNVAIGYQTQRVITGGIGNIGIGYRAQDALTTADYCIALGSSALGAVTEGDNNVAIGFNALKTITDQTYNTAVGAYAGEFSTGGACFFLGGFCGRYVAGNYNFAIGYQAMVGVSGQTDGTRNIAVGYQSQRAITSADDNISIGHESLEAVTTGSGNIAIGSDALTLLESGTRHTAIGTNAGAELTTTDNGVRIGYDAGRYDTDGYRLYIDCINRVNQAGEQTKSPIAGTFNAATANQSLRFNANVGIGTETFGTNSDFVFSMTNGTAPTTNPADQFQMYAADIVAGESAPHFETEHGDVIKLYQQANISDPSGGSVQDSEARTAIEAILDLLENAGLMAT